MRGSSPKRNVDYHTLPYTVTYSSLQILIVGEEPDQQLESCYGALVEGNDSVQFLRTDFTNAACYPECLQKSRVIGTSNPTPT